MDGANLISYRNVIGIPYKAAQHHYYIYFPMRFLNARYYFVGWIYTHRYVHIAYVYPCYSLVYVRRTCIENHKRVYRLKDFRLAYSFLSF